MLLLLCVLIVSLLTLVIWIIVLGCREADREAHGPLSLLPGPGPAGRFGQGYTDNNTNTTTTTTNNIIIMIIVIN